MLVRTKALFNLARTHQLRADDGTSQGFYHNATARHNTLLQSKFLFMDLLSRNSLEEAAPDVEALRCLEEVLYQVREIDWVDQMILMTCAIWPSLLRVHGHGVSVNPKFNPEICSNSISRVMPLLRLCAG